MNIEFTVEAKASPDQIQLETLRKDLDGRVQRIALDLVNLRDRAVHDALTAQGWLSPGAHARLLELLAYVIKQADGWRDDSRGGPITGDPLLDEARALVTTSPQSPRPAPGSTDH